jgi:serine/threonine protein kinase
LKVFQDASSLYFLFEFVPGGDFFDYRKRTNQWQMDEDVVRFYVAEVVLFLQHMHARDITYRDLKPENIMLGTDGHLRVVDFGFAKRLPPGHRYVSSSRLRSELPIVV